MLLKKNWLSSSPAKGIKVEKQTNKKTNTQPTNPGGHKDFLLTNMNLSDKANKI